MPHISPYLSADGKKLVIPDVLKASTCAAPVPLETAIYVLSPGLLDVFTGSVLSIRRALGLHNSAFYGAPELIELILPEEDQLELQLARCVADLKSGPLPNRCDYYILYEFVHFSFVHFLIHIYTPPFSN